MWGGTPIRVVVYQIAWSKNILLTDKIQCNVYLVLIQDMSFYDVGEICFTFALD